MCSAVRETACVRLFVTDLPTNQNKPASYVDARINSSARYSFAGVRWCSLHLQIRVSSCVRVLSVYNNKSEHTGLLSLLRAVRTRADMVWCCSRAPPCAGTRIA